MEEFFLTGSQLLPALSKGLALDRAYSSFTPWNLSLIRPSTLSLNYADDTTLLVPQNASTILEAEFSHILEWSKENKLKVNTLKTKEIVFHCPRLPKKSLPHLLPDIERTDCARIFGVHFTPSLTPTQHINRLISLCNQRLFLLSQFKHQGLPVEAFDVIFQTLVYSQRSPMPFKPSLDTISVTHSHGSARVL